MEILFECHEYSERTKIKLAISSFSEYALDRWDQVSSQRRRMGDQPVSSWELCKILIRSKFVPLHYYNELYQRLHVLQQGNKSVEDFHKELEVILMKANIVEDARATKAIFLSGLNREIANEVKLQSYGTLEEIVLMVMKIEKQLKRKIYPKESIYTNPIFNQQPM
jgi:hypothetical protein